MSWSKSVTLWCDGEDCRQHTGELPKPKVRAARHYASEKLGWVYRDGEDLCPRCQ